MSDLQTEDGVHPLHFQLVDEAPMEFVLEKGHAVRNFFRTRLAFGVLLRPEDMRLNQTGLPTNREVRGQANRREKQVGHFLPPDTQTMEFNFRTRNHNLFFL